MAVEKTAPRQQLLRVLITALTLSLIVVFFFAHSWYKERQRSLAEANQQILGKETQVASPSQPTRLRIPEINVNAAVEYVSFTPQGAMEVPSTITEVGWFELGPKPGERGSAVIAGHFNGKNGETGVFAELNKLKAGDKVYTEDKNGRALTFVVKESRTYDPGYAEEVFSQNDGTYLNLVTCDGMWDEIKNTYSKRLVIFTTLVN